MKEKPEELSNTRIREILWASHPCECKYGDDGELQCNRIYGHGNPIDFKRDSWSEIGKGLSRHTKAMVEQVKAEVAREIFEEIYNEMAWYWQTCDDGIEASRKWQSLKDKWLKESNENKTA